MVPDVTRKLKEEARKKALSNDLEVTSADLSLDAQRAKIMQKDWKTLSDMAYGVRKRSETCVEKDGELEG